jgi:RNA-directed DNA polymerase
MSGGPIINDQHQVIGVAKKGGIQERKQLAVEVAELLKLAGE